MAETLDRTLLFLEERAGISFGEASPPSRPDFDRAAKGLSQALLRDYPRMRGTEARAIARFTGFRSMGEGGTPWAGPAERAIARHHALSAMRALLARLPKGSADARAAAAWLSFYEGQKKAVVARPPGKGT